MDLEYVKELVADVTEGPWEVHAYPEGSVVRPAGSSLSILRVWLDAKGRPTPYLSAGDAHFIAAARGLVPRLADEVARLRSELARLREGLGCSPEQHPESHCHRCGGPNIIWSAPSPLWNQVMRGGDINGTEIHDGIVCPNCFAVLAEQAGIADLWRLSAKRVHVPLQTVTPSGRVWDEQRQQWVDPQPEPRTATGAEVRDALRGAPLLDGVVYPELTTAEAASITAGQVRRDADVMLDAIDSAISENLTPLAKMPGSTEAGIKEEE